MIVRHNAVSPPAAPPAPPFPRKRLKCRTDRGFMHPTASNRALFPRPSCATSSPGARSGRIRWSGPRECQAGSGPARFPAWSPAGRVPPSIPAARRPSADGGLGELWRGSACRSISTFWRLLWRSLVVHDRHRLVIPAPMGPGDGTSWIVPGVHVPGRPNLELHRPGRCDRSGTSSSLIGIWHIWAVELLSNLNDPHPDSAVLYWMVIQMDCIANLSSNGQPLRSAFDGSGWAYVGWQSCWCIFRHHHHRLGVGDYVPGCDGFAGISAARGAKSSSSAAAWKCCGERSCLRSAASSSSRFRGCMRWTRSGYVSQIRAGRPSRRATRTRKHALPALAHRAFLGHRRHQRAVGLEDQAAGQSAAVLRAG